MSPDRASAIAHGELPFHNPIAPAAIDTVLDLVAPAADSRTLDLGCGRGELLIRIAERYGAGGLGIDASGEHIALARREAAARVPDADLRFEARDAATLAASPGSFSLAACVGSSHALGGLDTTLERLAALVAPGGYLLVGEGYWEHPPSEELLTLLGASLDELTTLPDLLAAGASHGLELVSASTATREDWQRYEWTYVFNLDRYLRDRAAEEGADELRVRLDRIRGRRLLAAREGETLGFALAVWRRA